MRNVKVKPSTATNADRGPRAGASAPFLREHTAHRPQGGQHRVPESRRPSGKKPVPARQVRDPGQGRAIPDLRGSGVFATEPSPCGRHHPAEALLLFYKVAASTFSWEASRGRGGRRGLHDPGCDSGGEHPGRAGKAVRFLGVPCP